jgi:glutathionylspermidine synthase
VIRQLQVPRPDYENTVKSQGLLWPENYWLENASYSFSTEEITRLEKAAQELWGMFLQAGQRIVDENLFSRFGLNDATASAIRDSWNAEPPAIYGRFDFGYDGDQIKLFEFNADTPTGLVEAAVCQWEWKQDKFPKLDQWNNIHDYLIEKWKDVKDYCSPTVHFTCLKDALYEDWMTTAYMQEVATQAGLQTKFVPLEQIGEETFGGFIDQDGERIKSIFKLYPWEWLIKENKMTGGEQPQWIEPIWKMMWSNKEILVILWEMYPNHPLLLPAFDTPSGSRIVQKAKLGREGKNVIIHEAGKAPISRGGQYHDSGYIYQEQFKQPSFDGNYPVLGVWSIDGTPAGLGIREDSSLITGNTARFVPHLIEG